MSDFKVWKHKSNTLLASAIFVWAIAFTTCSIQSTTPDPVKHIITTSEPNRIRFHGKGAGAGMMLMSTMGPTGIAIGIAIDEGIGKDIDSTAKAAKVDIEKIFLDELDVFSRDSQNINKALHITIERYGFIVSPQNNDHAIPQLHLSIARSKDQQPQMLKYPGDYKTIASRTDSAPLDDVKTDAKIIERLLRDAAGFLVGGYEGGLISRIT